MQKIAILSVALLIQFNAFSQGNNNLYPFKVTIKGSGTPVLLIPGLSSSGEVWDETVEVLHKNFQCHIFTLAGFANQKPIPTENGYLPIIKKKLLEYIKSELSEEPILIGHSLGGFLALSMAVTNDNLFKKIIIVDSYPFMTAAYNPAATEENVAPQAKLMKQMLIQIPDSLYAYQQAMTMSTMITDSAKIQLALQWSLQSDRETVGQAMFELMTTDLRDKLSTVRVPLLILGSWIGGKEYGITKDITLANFKRQYALAENADIKIAETAKHFIMWDDFNWFLEETKAFLNNGN